MHRAAASNSRSPHKERDEPVGGAGHRRRVGGRGAVVHATTFIGLPILLMALAVAMSPAAEAQRTGKLPRIGMIGEFSPAHPFVTAFRQGLQDVGYTEGQNIVVEYRHAHDVLDRVSKLAAELVRLKVEILVVGGTKSAQLTKAQTTTVPIVFATSGDPVGSRLVASLAHPGGNVTGISILSPELSGKQLELLKATLPGLSRVAVLWDPQAPGSVPQWQESQLRARELGLQLHSMEVSSVDAYEAAFREAVEARNTAVWVTLKFRLLSVPGGIRTVFRRVA